MSTTQQQIVLKTEQLAKVRAILKSKDFLAAGLHVIVNVGAWDADGDKMPDVALQIGSYSCPYDVQLLEVLELGLEAAIVRHKQDLGEELNALAAFAAQHGIQ